MAYTNYVALSLLASRSGARNMSTARRQEDHKPRTRVRGMHTVGVAGACDRHLVPAPAHPHPSNHLPAPSQHPHTSTRKPQQPASAQPHPTRCHRPRPHHPGTAEAPARAGGRRRSRAGVRCYYEPQVWVKRVFGEFTVSAKTAGSRTRPNAHTQALHTHTPALAASPVAPTRPHLRRHVEVVTQPLQLSSLW